MRILITGGAGFVGSHLALAYRARYPSAEIFALDNLKRRGSELNLGLLKDHRVQFVHGDIRVFEDLDSIPGEFDVLVDASAEPSVLAGLSGSPRYLLETNLKGTLNCLEFARARAGAFLFLSTSRVYSILPLRELSLREAETRFELEPKQLFPGVSERGISENFPTDLPRSLYGATKLASELFVQEYAQTYQMKAVINRCGILAGAGQWGKSDQGVFTLWVARHLFNRPLTYTGFGGRGKQVRDLLHPADLFELLEKQLGSLPKGSAEIYNVGGGPENAVSLNEMTSLCQTLLRKKVTLHENAQSPSVDVPWYVSDTAKVQNRFHWKATRGVEVIVRDIADWISKNEGKLREVLDLG